MKPFFTIIFFLNSLIVFCQVDLFFPLTNEFNWEDVEKQNQEFKADFIKNLPEELGPCEECGHFSYLENDLHIIDFNGDGLDDIIYNGYLGEPMYIIIYINTGKSFTKIFTGTQQIHRIVIEDGKVRRLYIRDGGCCSVLIGVNKIYSVDYSDTLPKINYVSSMEYVDFRGHNYQIEVYPSHYFDKPIKFEILNDRYNIRFAPEIDDSTETMYCEDTVVNGNSLGKLKSGSIGYALAESVDSTGRIWWFVAMEPSGTYETIYHKLTYNKFGFYKLGWISSRFVKEINE